MQYDISPETLEAKAKEAYGEDVKISAPYWVDDMIVRCGIWFPNSEISFGVNYWYKEGRFQ